MGKPDELGKVKTPAGLFCDVNPAHFYFYLPVFGKLVQRIAQLSLFQTGFLLDFADCNSVFTFFNGAEH